MKLGISTYALTWSFGIPGYDPKTRLSLPEFLDLAANWGYQGVQIADNAPLLECTPEERQALWHQAKELGLFVEIGARGLTKDNLETHIEIADEVGSPFLRFVIDGPGFEPSLSELPDLLRRAAKKCEEKGIILAIENHDRFESHQFAAWFDAIDSPYLGLCLDSVNSYGCGEGFRETIDTLLPYAVNFHLKDFSVRRQDHMLGFLIEGRPAGEGLLPIQEILEGLEKNSRCKSVTVEHWPALQDSVAATVKMEKEWCSKSIQNLKIYIPDLD
ncbi:MAG: sugar phosphate isomerase/epimerase [Verrucomicrobia bacterium]|nr:sugar phosphate isomerase/epimerase [Verrucomicrobiota bacterium]